MALIVPIIQAEPQRDYTDCVVNQTPANAQAFVPKQLLTIAAGVVSVAASAVTGIFGVALGYAVDPVFGKANGTIPVLRARAGQRFLMNANGALAQANVGGKYGLLVNAQGLGLVDLTNTTEELFEVIEIFPAGVLPNGGIGDTNPRVLVELLASAVQ